MGARGARKGEAMTKQLCDANEARARWAAVALEAFSETCGPQLFDDEDATACIGDLIGDLLHYADRRGLDALSIVRKGIGMWAAESRAPDGEPMGNDEVEVTIYHEREVARG